MKSQEKYGLSPMRQNIYEEQQFDYQNISYEIPKQNVVKGKKIQQLPPLKLKKQSNQSQNNPQQKRQQKKQEHIDQSQINIYTTNLQNTAKKSNKQSRQRQSISQYLLNVQKGSLQPGILQNQQEEQIQITIDEKLKGKLNIIWIFVLTSKKIRDLAKIKERICFMYQGFKKNNRLKIPLLNSYKEIQNFLKIQNCFFKIVTDVQNSQNVLSGYKTHLNYDKILDFYIYNQKNLGIFQIGQIKRHNRRLREVFKDWQKILPRAEQQIVNQIQQISQNQFRIQKTNAPLPNLFQLNNVDKEYATKYRTNLFRAVNLEDQQIQIYYNKFMDLVERRFKDNQKQMKNIQQYKKIALKNCHIQSIDQCKNVLRTYCQESFYHKTTNSLLRTPKTTQEFEPCIFPFNKTFHSIKKIYEQYLNTQTNKITQQYLYRGFQASQRQLAKLQPEAYIQIQGFMSTTQDEQIAKSYTEQTGYIFVIKMPKRQIDQNKYKFIDHGFVKVNQFGLAFYRPEQIRQNPRTGILQKIFEKDYSKQKQIIFNAFNIFKVYDRKKVDRRQYIYLEYGVIFDLLEKDINTLTPEQEAIIVNFGYCQNIQKQVTCKGDALFLQNQLESSQKYFIQRIRILKQKQQKEKSQKITNNLFQNFAKLANVQSCMGKIKQANKNIKEFQQIIDNMISQQTKQKFMKTYAFYRTQIDLNLKQQDYLTASRNCDSLITKLKKYQPQNALKLAINIRESGEIKLLKGEVQLAKKDFKQSLKYIQKINGSVKIEQKQSFWDSFKKALCCYSQQTQQKKIIKKQLNKNQLQKIKQEEKIKNINLKIINSLVSVEKYLGNQQDAEFYLQKGYQFFIKKCSIQLSQKTPLHRKAQQVAMKALLQGYQYSVKTQQLLQQVIKNLQKIDQFSIQVENYNHILGKIRHRELEKYLTPNLHVMKDKPKQKQQYVKSQIDRLYQKCKQNYEKVIFIKQSKSTKENKYSNQILSKKNSLANLALNMNDFKECNRLIKKTIQQTMEQRQKCDRIIQQTKKDIQKNKNINMNVFTSQTAKLFLIKAKLHFNKGQLKNAFQSLNQSQKHLKKALVQSHTKKPQNQNDISKKLEYQETFRKNQIYIEIHIVKVNVYNKQKMHELSLETIETAQKLIRSKVSTIKCHPFYPMIQQLRVFNEIVKCQFSNLSKRCQKIIQLRQKQLGFYHILNAKTYCHVAIYLVESDELIHLEQAKRSIQKAIQIMECYSKNLPQRWILYWAKGKIKQKQKQLIKSNKYFQGCLKIIKQNYDQSHIKRKQVALRYVKSLSKIIDQPQLIKSFSFNGSNSKISQQQSIKLCISQFQQLKSQIQKDLQQTRRSQNNKSSEFLTSNHGQQVKQIDDQKLLIKSQVLSQIAKLNTKLRQTNRSR